MSHQHTAEIPMLRIPRSAQPAPTTPRLRSAHIPVWAYVLVVIAVFSGASSWPGTLAGSPRPAGARRSVPLRCPGPTPRPAPSQGKHAAPGAGAAPEDVKGWMTLQQVLDAFPVTKAALYEQFGIPADTGTDTTLSGLKEVGVSADSTSRPCAPGSGSSPPGRRIESLAKSHWCGHIGYPSRQHSIKLAAPRRCPRPPPVDAPTLANLPLYKGGQGCSCGLHDQQDRDQPQGPHQPGALLPVTCSATRCRAPQSNGPTTCPGARRYGLAGRSRSRESRRPSRVWRRTSRPGRRRPYQVTPKEASHTTKYVAVARIIREYGSTDVPNIKAIATTRTITPAAGMCRPFTPSASRCPVAWTGGGPLSTSGRLTALR